MPPPGLMPATESPGEHITGERESDLSSKSAKERFLVAELGLTYPQAKKLIRAYEQDCAAAVRIGNDTHRSDHAFIDWLMRQAPGPGRQRGVLKHGWKVAS